MRWLIAAYEADASLEGSPATTDAPTESRSIRHIGPYEIIRRLGAGGMGEVFLADDRHLGRQVAIKMLAADLAVNSDRIRRLGQEARAASALNHPNIVTIHDFGEIDGNHYIVQEFVEGETLRQRMSRGRLPVSCASAI